MPTATVDQLDPRLVERAQRIVNRTGKVPSQRALMDALKIGRPRAAQVLAALTDAPEDATPDAPEVQPADAPETTEPGTAERAPDAPEAATEAQPEPHPETHPDAPAECAPIVLLDAPADAPRTHLEPAVDRTPEPVADTAETRTFVQVTPVVDAPAGRTPDAPASRTPRWPLLILCAPAFVAIWAGWVALGKLTGFGKVNLLPGIGPGWVVDTAITLPIGVETYAAYALWVWLSGRAPARAQAFARWSAIASLSLGAAGQIAYHLMAAAKVTSAPWQITTIVACLPVAVLGAGAALAHLMHTEESPCSAPT